MKTRKTFAFIFLPLMVLSSCQYKSDDDMAKEEYISVVNRILENKIDELKSLFACNISSKIIRFQDQVIELINYVTGEYKSSKYTGTGAQYMIDDFKQVRFCLWLLVNCIPRILSIILVSFTAASMTLMLGMLAFGT